MSKPRITLICTGLGVVQRGFESYMLDLAEKISIDNNYFDIELFTGGPYKNERVNSKQLPCISRNNWFFNKSIGANLTSELELITFFLSLVLRIYSNNISVIYLGEYNLYCYLYKIRKILKLKFSLILYTGGQVYPGLYDEKKDYVHHVTDIYYKELMRQGYPINRQFVIPHFIAEPKVKISDNIIDIRNKAKNKKIIISVGLIDRKVKRMDLLVQVLGKKASEYFPVILGEYTKDTPAIIKELEYNFGKNGYILAKVNKEEIFEYLKQANLFILLSPKESFGLAYLEALSVGLPVISCDYYESNYVLRDMAVFVNSTDPISILETIDSTVSNIKSLDEIEKRKRFVNDNYSWRVLKNRYFEMFNYTLIDNIS